MCCTNATCRTCWCSTMNAANSACRLHLKPVRTGQFAARRSFFVLAREPDGPIAPNPRIDHSPLLLAMVRQAASTRTLKCSWFR
jgi:hypothetical protein